MVREVAPERIELGRMRRGLTKNQLAADLGMRARDLRRVLTGEAAQPEDFAQQVSTVLNLPVSFLTAGPVEVPGNISFRKLASLTAREQASGKSVAVFGKLIADWLNSTFSNVPAPDLPDLAREEPEVAAAACREWMGLNSRAVPHMIGALEHAGVAVFALDEKTNRLNAYAFWQEGRPYVFLNQQKSAEASRFDAAHELAHLVMDREGPATGKEVESRADAFAAAFLMPRAEFIARRPRHISLSSLIEAKGHFKVSLAAMIRRCKDTGLIDENRYRWLHIEASRKGFLRDEPKPTLRESSVLWPGVRRAMLARRIDASAVAQLVGLPVDEFLKMTWSGEYRSTAPSDERSASTYNDDPRGPNVFNLNQHRAGC
ncbi:MAG: ImmA/IrrE family metallo-endopeptidase [Limimaricola soesokkakensis]|uniref:ImmA/IrrE family metallo-endopeptidase n=1 Tax=Limimaricola soesokkakensis TaxID=1343159 RepID=UPI00405A1DAD